MWPQIANIWMSFAGLSMITEGREATSYAHQIPSQLPVVLTREARFKWTPKLSFPSTHIFHSIFLLQTNVWDLFSKGIVCFSMYYYFLFVFWHESQLTLKTQRFLFYQNVIGQAGWCNEYINCTNIINISNDNNCWHLLSMYDVSGTVRTSYIDSMI